MYEVYVFILLLVKIRSIESLNFKLKFDKLFDNEMLK